MDYTQEKYDGYVIESVNLPRATLKEAIEFKQVLLHDIAIGDTRIIVDLSMCEFIDSTFLGALVVSLKKAVESGGDVRLIGFQSAVESMFHLTRLDRVFQTFKTKSDAINSYRSELLQKYS